MKGLKIREWGFLASVANEEVFDYVQELHRYLWRFIEALEPGTGGHLRDHLDRVIDNLETGTAYTAEGERPKHILPQVYLAQHVDTLAPKALGLNTLEWLEVFSGIDVYCDYVSSVLRGEDKTASAIVGQARANMAECSALVVDMSLPANYVGCLIEIGIAAALDVPVFVYVGDSDHYWNDRPMLAGLVVGFYTDKKVLAAAVNRAVYGYNIA